MGGESYSCISSSTKRYCAPSHMGLRRSEKGSISVGCLKLESSSYGEIGDELQGRLSYNALNSAPLCG